MLNSTVREEALQLGVDGIVVAVFIGVVANRRHEGWRSRDVVCGDPGDAHAVRCDKLRQCHRVPVASGFIATRRQIA
jgi:hypothetical protein